MNTENNTRLSTAKKTTIVGLVLNMLLAGVKMTVGFLSGSISIQADGVNNLTDGISSAAALFCFTMAGKLPDKEHPFGHARMEYLSGLVISLLILVVGVEFLKSSITRIIYPEPIVFNLLFAVLIFISIVVKLVLGLYYRRIGKKIDSPSILASSFDSFSDVAITSLTLFSFIISPFTTFPIDGVAGLLVAAFVIITGVRSALDIINLLIGASPDKNLTDKIVKLLTSYDHILGVHDLLVHDYGPGNIIASIHAEMPGDLSFSETHSQIDRAEKKALELLGVELLIHADPVDTGNAELQRIRYELRTVLRGIDPALSYHDLRFNGENEVFFDLVAPYKHELQPEILKEQITSGIKGTNQNLTVSFRIDRV